MGLTKVEGLFKKYKIFFDLSGNNVSKLSGKILVDSVDTNDVKRDGHLKKEDFFYKDKHPHITISNTEPFSLIQGESVRVPLKVTIRGVTKTLEANLIYLGKRVDPWTKKSGLYFKGTFKLNRYDFGIRWNKVLDEGGLLIGKEALINFDFEAYPSNEKPAFSRFYKPQNIRNSKKKVTKTYSSPPVKNHSPKNISKDSKKAIEKGKYFSGTNVIVTIFTGFILFIIMILIGVFGQKKIVDYLEKKKIDDGLIFMISSFIIMIVLIVISIFAAPYMGWGVNPLLK